MSAPHATHSEHQRDQMSRNPRQNSSVAKPSAAGTQSLSGMAASAKSKADSAVSGSGSLRAPHGSSSPAANPIAHKRGA